MDLWISEKDRTGIASQGKRTRHVGRNNRQRRCGLWESEQQLWNLEFSSIANNVENHFPNICLEHENMKFPETSYTSSEIPIQDCLYYRIFCKPHVGTYRMFQILTIMRRDFSLGKQQNSHNQMRNPTIFVWSNFRLFQKILSTNAILEHRI